MYDGKTQLLIENPINRYLINSPMLPDMKKNADGSLTLYIQKDSPGKDKESNWLPAPNGPIYLVMRLYWPKTEPPSILPAGEGTWKPPAIVAGEVKNSSAKLRRHLKMKANVMRGHVTHNRFVVAILLAGRLPGGAHGPEVTPAEARAIAKEAYIYGYPMVDSYRIQYAYFVDRKNPEYKAPGTRSTTSRASTRRTDKAIQTPNSDTPYSFVGMDLRAEPIVLTVPAIEKERYFSIQLIDAYTFNFAYIGSRATGNEGGSFLIAGPGWKGETPKGMKKVIRSETEFVLAALSHAALQSRRPRQREEGAGRLQGAAAVGVPRHSRAESRAGHRFHQAAHARRRRRPRSQFFNILNFVLQFCPTHPVREAN